MAAVWDRGFWGGGGAWIEIFGGWRAILWGFGEMRGPWFMVGCARVWENEAAGSYFFLRALVGSSSFWLHCCVFVVATLVVASGNNQDKEGSVAY